MAVNSLNTCRPSSSTNQAWLPGLFFLQVHTVDCKNRKQMKVHVLQQWFLSIHHLPHLSQIKKQKHRIFGLSNLCRSSYEVKIVIWLAHGDNYDFYLKCLWSLPNYGLYIWITLCLKSFNIKHIFLLQGIWDCDVIESHKKIFEDQITSWGNYVSHQ